MPTVGTTEIIIRLLVALVLTAIIGFEREYYRKPAGLRTIVLVGLSSALFTLISFRIRDIFPGSLADPGRIAAQVVTGIGFLGAGAIIRARGEIIGLTTAASIFVAAAIGMAAAYGLYVEAVVVTILTLLTFYGLSYVVVIIRRKSDVPPQIGEETSTDEEAEKRSIVMH